MLDSVSDRLELAHTMHGSIVEAARGAVAMWSPRKFTFGNADVVATMHFDLEFHFLWVVFGSHISFSHQLAWRLEMAVKVLVFLCFFFQTGNIESHVATTMHVWHVSFAFFLLRLRWVARLATMQLTLCPQHLSSLWMKQFTTNIFGRIVWWWISFLVSWQRWPHGVRAATAMKMNYFRTQRGSKGQSTPGMRETVVATRGAVRLNLLQGIWTNTSNGFLRELWRRSWVSAMTWPQISTPPCWSIGTLQSTRHCLKLHWRQNIGNFCPGR